VTDCLIVTCGFCRQKNRVLLTRLEDAKCAACKVPLAEPIADLLLAEAQVRRATDLGGFLRDAENTARLYRGTDPC
jgi:hypothetical protein